MSGARSSRDARIVLVWLLALAPMAGARGEEAGGDEPLRGDGLTAVVRTPLPVPRPYAPFPLEVTLAARGTATRQGRLAVRVSEDGRFLCRWEGEPWLLGADARTAKVLLPPLGLEPGYDQLDLALAWQEGDRSVPLGTRTLRGGRSERTLALALCLPATGDETGQGLALALALALERYAPSAGDDAGVRAGVRTVPARLQADQLPEQALAWCAYDLVAIGGERLGELKARQVQALEQWLRAGGACCLLAGTALPPALAAMLARAAREDGGRSSARAADAHLRLRVGLGRMVVAPPDVDADQPQWRTSAAFLWRLRADQAAVLARSPAWSRELLEATAAAVPTRRGSKPATPSAFTDHQFDLGAPLTDLLWPEQVAIIPFWVILAVFLGFVLAVGPGDWFLLGRLRARRFTWVLFPVLAVTATCLTLWISRQYLGSGDQRRRLEIVDLGAGGQVLRHHRFELVFAGSALTAREEEQDALWAPLGSGPERSRYRGMIQGDDGETGGEALYRGTLPGRYQVEQPIAQWTPALRRELSFSPCALPWPLDLDRIAAPSDVAEVAAAWLRSVGGRGAMAVFRDGKIVERAGDATLLEPAHRGRGYAVYDAPPKADWFEALNVHPARGWFALTATVGPQGGPTGDDLPLHDPADHDQFLVVFAARRDGALWLARRLFHARGAAPAVPGPPSF
jgi:hypothetical protein